MEKRISIGLPHVFLLGAAALLISVIGATFSVSGLAKLFSGAPLAVMLMAGSLEFAKFTAAAFLHRHWRDLAFSLKAFLTVVVFVLMTITSLGIFGYLSHAYQKSSAALNNVMIRQQTLQIEDRKVQEELERIQKNLDEVPKNRISKKIELEKEAEPEIQNLKKRSFEINISLQQTMIEKQGLQTELGPLVYVAEAFDISMNKIARWFISLFVCIFDPLAVCLVIATSWALKTRDLERAEKRRAAHAAAPLSQEQTDATKASA
jgi:hypothetical protein